MPLVFPQEPAGGWSRFGGRRGRVAVAMLFGVLLLGIAGVVAWTAIDTGGDDSDSPVGVGPPVPVTGGLPPAATPLAGDAATPVSALEGSIAQVDDVAGDNMDMQAESLAATPRSRQSLATRSATPAAGRMHATAASLPASPAARASLEPVAATPAPAPSPTVAATPAASATPTRAPAVTATAAVVTAGSVGAEPASTYSGSLVSALTLVIAGIEAPPAAPPESPPAGDGTGGVPLPTPPGT